MAAGLDVWVSVAYITLFLIAAFRAGEYRWLWGSVLLWLVVGMAGTRLLPGLWGIAYAAPLYVPHFYITLASLFFFVSRWQKAPGRGRWQAEGGGGFISLFAVSGALMSSVFAVLFAMVVWHFPAGITPYVLPAMLQVYALKPVYWFGMQAVLMGVFYTHRCIIDGEAANFFSSRQLQAGVLMSILLQAACVVMEVLKVRYG